MGTLQDCLHARRSVRNFQDRPVPRDTLQGLAADAVLAPSGSNIQPWEFILVDDPELVGSIVTYSPGIVHAPPCLAVICSDQERALRKGGRLGKEQLALMDISMAAENLMLSAVDRGLGSCAVKSFPPQVIQKLLGLPENIWPELIVTLGYPVSARLRVPPKRPAGEMIHFNGWGEEDCAGLL
ncbi:MAG: nitroreductase family protein [Oscillibacter sp.]|nr:nitroreductase family protein [Oscillibacter sp.]